MCCKASASIIVSIYLLLLPREEHCQSRQHRTCRRPPSERRIERQRSARPSRPPSSTTPDASPRAPITRASSPVVKVAAFGRPRALSTTARDWTRALPPPVPAARHRCFRNIYIPPRARDSAAHSPPSNCYAVTPSPPKLQPAPAQSSGRLGAALPIYHTPPRPS